MEHPKIYIGDQFGNMIVYEAEFWYVSAEKYVKAAVENVEQNIEKSNQRLPNCCKTPIISGYRTETDTSPNLKSEGVTQYQDMVGVISWSVELSQVDILLETALMSTDLYLPFRGNIEQVLNIFVYLKLNP